MQVQDVQGCCVLRLLQFQQTTACQPQLSRSPAAQAFAQKAYPGLAFSSHFFPVFGQQPILSKRVALEPAEHVDGKMQPIADVHQNLPWNFLQIAVAQTCSSCSAFGLGQGFADSVDHRK